MACKGFLRYTLTFLDAVDIKRPYPLAGESVLNKGQREVLIFLKAFRAGKDRDGIGCWISLELHTDMATRVHFKVVSFMGCRHVADFNNLCFLIRQLITPVNDNGEGMLVNEVWDFVGQPALARERE